VYTTVIAGDISTRISARPGEEASYQTGSTLVESPGEGLHIGDAGPASARVISTALLPTNAPLTMYQNGLTSNAYPTLTDWFWVQDIDFGVPCPITVSRSTVEVDRPEGAFDLVQLVLDLNPGISTPRHIHGGQEFSVVIAGNVTLQRGDTIQVLGAGESWVNASRPGSRST
jgi:hypothetical protein